jgi:hypothetical protein
MDRSKRGVLVRLVVKGATIRELCEECKRTYAKPCTINRCHSRCADWVSIEKYPVIGIIEECRVQMILKHCG